MMTTMTSTINLIISFGFSVLSAVMVPLLVVFQGYVHCRIHGNEKEGHFPDCCFGWSTPAAVNTL